MVVCDLITRVCVCGDSCARAWRDTSTRARRARGCASRASLARRTASASAAPSAPRSRAGSASVIRVR